MSISRWRETLGRVLALILDTGCRARYDIRTRGLENFSRSPSTVVVFNHRRDADTPIIGNIFFGRRGLLAHGIAPIFVAREDLFRNGFLTNYLEDWPSPIRRVLYPLNLRPFLWGLRAHPMRRIAERTLGEVLEDVLRIFGDLPLDKVLRPDWVQRFEELADPEAKPIHIRQALTDRYHPLLSMGFGLTKLTRNQFRAIKPYERATIEAHLQRFVEFLERGEVLQLAPEGAVSRDGRFSRIRAGLHVLLNRPRTLVSVLPVGITYDFMTCGRQRVFVNAGKEMTDLRGLKPAEASARVSEAILAQSTITASQLASQLLLSIRSQGGGILSRSQISDYVAAEAQRWAKTGLYVDPRLMDNGAREIRMAEYVEYCLRSGELLLRGSGHYWVPRCVGQVSPSWANPEGAVTYTSNELTSVSQLLAVRD